MLQHQNPSPKLPTRVVVVGAAGFVGSALVKTLKARGASVLPLTRRDIDLLAPDAQDKLASMLRPDDTFVAVAARAPCKSVQMLTENMKIVESMVGALTKSPVSHLVNISSDAVYADSPDPLTEESCCLVKARNGAITCRSMMSPNSLRVSSNGAVRDLSISPPERSIRSGRSPNL